MTLENISALCQRRKCASVLFLKATESNFILFWWCLAKELLADNNSCSLPSALSLLFWANKTGWRGLCHVLKTALYWTSVAIGTQELVSRCWYSTGNWEYVKSQQLCRLLPPSAYVQKIAVGILRRLLKGDKAIQLLVVIMEKYITCTKRFAEPEVASTEDVCILLKKHMLSIAIPHTLLIDRDRRFTFTFCSTIIITLST